MPDLPAPVAAKSFTAWYSIDEEIAALLQPARNHFSIQIDRPLAERMNFRPPVNVSATAAFGEPRKNGLSP
jgi:hypothetical protein